ncbi:tRNA (N(6)-L-threonylcarbamoyladenosine(37)-C(2))-methylthiotransferase MtaB [Sediminispirochaeta smaragdinae]|uniref:MiaB-like tRNA modifying enzyme n=1 Tax=Sediminispirochaeta smaragdinae (strain DSM 11293 / JCM 15392 / SEBR 4228) TaxID=573413 RepID=E1R5M8_SEDSS|nr:tRNA (N(6)-L-threonylcarbamoyladenosine(37)-C(2))-methylthiotransferase MtaB [Sediminispirochaeta smaragdinae]ADK80643.1 MiaB-like tRNA modifying enzyme [Sediminispirochaeta smaragdinae DSM 11293]
MRVSFFTLGCKLNQSESEALATAFGRRGFSLVPPSAKGKAEVFVVNSCTVTSKAEQKARRMIRSFARNNPLSVVLVTGCYAQMDPDQVAALGENVVVLPLSAKASILDLPEFLESAAGGYTLLDAVQSFAREKSAAAFAGDPSASDRFRFEISGAEKSGRSRGFLKIQDGCDNACTYCRVRLARGPSVSLASSEVLRRAAALADEGFGEIVLTGVNLTAWQEGDLRFADLLALMTSDSRAYRIRLSSTEPDAIDEKLASAASSPRVRPHFHLPVQSGSDTVLASVGRHYTADDVLRAVALLRKAKEDPFLAADIIVGLPGESDADFEATLSLVERCGFAHIHAFPFSPRPGTPLYTARGRVPERIAAERMVEIGRLSSQLHASFVARRAGSQEEAVIERLPENGQALVLTDRYLHLPCDAIPPSEKRGDLCRVLLDYEPDSESLRATFIQEIK